MKTLLLALALSIAASAFAAAPVVTIDENQNTFVDGSNFGKVGDVFVNHKNNAALLVAVNVALGAHIEKIKADAAAAVAAAAAEKTAAVNAANTAKAAAETAKAAEVAKTAAIVVALKGVNQATLPAAVKAELLTANQKAKADLQAQKAAIEAQLSTIP